MSDKGDHHYRKKAKGSVVGGYARPRTQIGFDDKTRKAIAAWAKFNNQSFASEVRALVAFALSRKTR
jgi:hypothetical protein